MVFWTEEDENEWLAYDLWRDEERARIAALKEKYGDDYTEECECGHYCEKCVL